MVCFVLHITQPLGNRECNNVALERRIQHLAHHCNAQLSASIQVGRTKEYEVKLCDHDTVAFLRDFPIPFAVNKIDVLHSNYNLYTHRKHHSPPQIPLLKDIYWLAKSTERWRTPISNELYQTK